MILNDVVDGFIVSLKKLAHRTFDDVDVENFAFSSLFAYDFSLLLRDIYTVTLHSKRGSPNNNSHLSWMHVYFIRHAAGGLCVDFYVSHCSYWASISSSCFLHFSSSSFLSSRTSFSCVIFFDNALCCFLVIFNDDRRKTLKAFFLFEIASAKPRDYHVLLIHLICF